MTTKDDLQEIKSNITDDLKYSNWMYNEYRLGAGRYIQSFRISQGGNQKKKWR